MHKNRKIIKKGEFFSKQLCYFSKNWRFIKKSVSLQTHYACGYGEKSGYIYTV